MGKKRAPYSASEILRSKSFPPRKETVSKIED